MPIQTTNHISQYPSTFYRVSLKAIIRNTKGYILVNKEGGSTTWNLPGGGWDHGETEHEALARELKEEVGYEGGFTARPSATAVFWLESKKAWLLWIVYDVQPEHSNFTTGEESSEVVFIDPRSFKDATSFEERWIYATAR
jgi:8-oxo-dGTP pyrophosphatase MutT (NUDIX family)